MRGTEAEDEVVAWLARRGRPVLARNFRAAGGELDVVALDGRTVCIVEVRARKRGALVNALESIDGRKRRRIERAAQAFVSVRGLGARALRFDVAAVDGDALTYYEAAWESE